MSVRVSPGYSHFVDLEAVSRVGPGAVVRVPHHRRHRSRATRRAPGPFDTGRPREPMSVAGPHPSAEDRQPRSWTWWVTAAALCALVGLSRLPLLHAPASPDEGGFLVVSSQWHSGTSLYGDYWVDRPPLLIAVFAVAHLLGGVVALRVIGLAAVMAAVGSAAAIGWLGSGRRAAGAVACAVTASALLGSPLFGSGFVDGELLASPLILGGLTALLAAHGTPRHPRTTVLLVLAGALGAAAFLVKQDMVDVFVVAAALVAHELGRHGVRSASMRLLPFLVGAVGTLLSVTAVATSRGTTLRGLWEAVVTFRFAAHSQVVFSQARLNGLLHAYAVSGALSLALIAVLICLLHHRTALSVSGTALPLASTAIVLCAYETMAVVAGGGYWSHYLVGLVPGLVVLVAAAFRDPGRLSRTLLGLALGYAAASSVVSWSEHLGAATTGNDQLVSGYLRDHEHPGDTVVVAFGHANIVHDAGLPSPYPYLWELPALVKDPRLTGLDDLLRSSSAPRWFVSGGDLTLWGHAGTVLQHTVTHRYRAMERMGRWVVWEREG
jgi:hypothetical protein